jgi:ankyrin repeat protein
MNAFDDSLSRTPLHYAAIGGHTAVVRYLIEAGADVNLREEEKIGNTVLAEIAQSCSLEMATILIEAGADPTIPGWMRLTALDRSEKRKKPEGQQVHKLLCEAAKRCNFRSPRLNHFLKSMKSTP